MKERLSKEKEDLEKRFKLIMDKFVYRTDYSVSSTVYDKDGNEYCNVVKPLINPMTVHYNSLEEYSNVVFSELSDFDKDIDVWDFSKNVGFI